MFGYYLRHSFQFFPMAKYIFWFVWFIFTGKLKASSLSDVHCSSLSPLSFLSWMGFVWLLTVDSSLILLCGSGSIGGLFLRPLDAISNERQRWQALAVRYSKLNSKRRKNKLSLVEIHSPVACIPLHRPSCGLAQSQVCFLLSATNWCLHRTSCGITFMSGQKMTQKAHNIFLNQHQRRCWIHFFSLSLFFFFFSFCGLHCSWNVCVCVLLH